jgi:hypothetical protein
MRLFFALPLLLTTGCGVVNDPQNDQVTLQYNEQRIEQTASDVGNSAENMGEAIANEASETADRVDNSGIVADGEGAETPPAENNQ